MRLRVDLLLLFHGVAVAAAIDIRACYDSVVGSQPSLETVAGALGRPGLAKGPYGGESLFKSPKGLVIDPVERALFVSDSGNHAVRRISISGGATTAVTIAGALGVPGDFGEDCLATDAQLNDPHGLALDAENRLLYIADSLNHAIRRVDLVRGVITTVVGVLGVAGNFGDQGYATRAQLNFPVGLAIDTVQQRLYIADSLNHAVRAVDLASGIIVTIAGVLGVSSGLDDVVASSLYESINLHSPTGLALDPAGFLYVAEGGAHRVRQLTLSEGKIDSNCKCRIQVASLSGLGSVSSNPGGRPSIFRSNMRSPSGIALDPDYAHLFVTDSASSNVLKVNLEAGNISTLLSRPGRYPKGYGGRVGLAVDVNEGILYMAETTNHVVRKIGLYEGEPTPPTPGTCP